MTKKFKEVLQESSLTRGWKLTQKHDYGCITAFRDKRDCGNGKEYTKAENMARNRNLLAKLRMRGRFGITKLKGIYIENYKSKNAKEKKEETFLAIDLDDSGILKDVLTELGEEFEQDSILFGEAGKNPVLIGTNHCPDAYPGYGVVEKLGKGLFGQKGEFYSRVNGRPFVFEGVVYGMTTKKYPSEMRGESICAKKHWSKLVNMMEEDDG